MRSFAQPLLPNGSINSNDHSDEFKVVVSSPDHEEKKDEPSVHFQEHILHLIMDYCDLSSGFGVSAFSENKQENVLLDYCGGDREKLGELIVAAFVEYPDACRFSTKLEHVSLKEAARWTRNRQIKIDRALGFLLFCIAAGLGYLLYSILNDENVTDTKAVREDHENFGIGMTLGITIMSVFIAMLVRGISRREYNDMDVKKSRFSRLPAIQDETIPNAHELLQRLDPDHKKTVGDVIGKLNEIVNRKVGDKEAEKKPPADQAQAQPRLSSLYCNFYRPVKVQPVEDAPRKNRHCCSVM